MSKREPFSLERYSPTTVRDHPVEVSYDNFREHGIPKHIAREWAKKAADQQNKTLDKHKSGDDVTVVYGRGKSIPPPVRLPGGRMRVPFPWEQDDDADE